MPRVRKSIRVMCGILLFAFVTTGVWYVWSISLNGGKWINRANNTRLADAKKTTMQGTITDRYGIVVAKSDRPGTREYSADEGTRRSLSHTIGDQRNMSYTGVENNFATTLLGIDSTKAGYTVQLIAGLSPIGNGIRLTVSAELSAYLSSIFPRDVSGESFNGAICVINYKTGEILAMVSMPEYDPANMDAPVKDTAYFNRVLQTRYAPGSVFKIVTLMSVLTNLPQAAEETFSCDGSWDFDGYLLKCAGEEKHGVMTLTGAFAKSCNVAFGQLARRLGANSLLQTAQALGFNTTFAFDDVILNASNFATDITVDSELIQTGIGQGRTEVTPLHMAMIAGAIANGGVMMEPKLIMNVTSPTGAIKTSMQTEPYARVMNEETALTIAQSMYEVVKNGTGTRARIDGYSGGYVCGKTGSAEWTDDKEAATHAWYTGFLYGDERHPFAVSVIVEKAGSGGAVAAPIAAKALQKAIEIADAE